MRNNLEATFAREWSNNYFRTYILPLAIELFSVMAFTRMASRCGRRQRPAEGGMHLVA